ncbi:MAG: hypothetical protein JXA21_19215 [Anaerolineae bacterium]|nr:hypothetical protein [Anaerolineae bacterium]
MNFLFIDAIAWLCDGDGVFVGRSASPASYEALLGALGVAEDHPLRELLDRLGTRGFIFGYGWANGDGVHGWLDGEECGQLAEYLWPLDLPRYPATPENLETWQPGRQRDSEHDWDKLVLAYIRAMAEYAAGKDFGIVWMNDVSLDVRDREGPFRQWMKTH